MTALLIAAIILFILIFTLETGISYWLNSDEQAEKAPAREAGKSYKDTRVKEEIYHG
ncbi:hypothetical protein [Peribacillus kribbensis]|uniref:hypothetical protein n=1 Tax=Peribacillus kribbensis TaxID=356658 RepID=UPI0003FC24D1|nr:hypothetical protein [Peribacillus kribbensis]